MDVAAGDGFEHVHKWNAGRAFCFWLVMKLYLEALEIYP